MENIHIMVDPLVQIHPKALRETQIAEDVDTQGNCLTVWKSDQLGGSRAIGLFLRVYSEIIDKNYTMPYISFTDGNKINVVYLMDDKEVVAGGIAFEYRQVTREGWIVLSFTNPDFRKRGINQLAHNHFEEIVRNMGGQRIGSNVHVNNTSRLKAAERAGMKPIFHRMSKWLY